MANASSSMGLNVSQTISQLAQVRAALEEANEVFGRKDQSGRTPIVVVPKRQNRIRWGTITLGILVFIGGVAAGSVTGSGAIGGLATFLAILLVLFGMLRAFYIQVPEGVSALLARGGKHVATVGSGLHFISPWTLVSHIVTRKEIPYDAPVKEAPTRDNVRAAVDCNITFAIQDPYAFVYRISPDGFDSVFQAACQDALRSMVRQVTSDQVYDLASAETAGLREALNTDIAQYGVIITKVNITDARPPSEFLASQEARQLAILQRKEQEERQALAQQRQRDEEALQRQQVVARVEREREQLQSQVAQAESQRQIAELQAQSEMLRLDRLEAALRNNPTAAERELRMAQIDVLRALAGNSRAVLQIGGVEELTRAFLMRDAVQETGLTGSDGRQAPTVVLRTENGRPGTE